MQGLEITEFEPDMADSVIKNWLLVPDFRKIEFEKFGSSRVIQVTNNRAFWYLYSQNIYKCWNNWNFLPLYVKRRPKLFTSFFFLYLFIPFLMSARKHTPCTFAIALVQFSIEIVWSENYDKRSVKKPVRFPYQYTLYIFG